MIEIGLVVKVTRYSPSVGFEVFRLEQLGRKFERSVGTGLGCRWSGIHVRSWPRSYTSQVPHHWLEREDSITCHVSVHAYLWFCMIGWSGYVMHTQVSRDWCTPGQTDYENDM